MNANPTERRSVLPLKDAYPEALDTPMFRLLSELAAEHELYVVGGFVRDFLLGKPGKDVDLVTIGSGVELAQEFARRAHAGDIVTYENFGTALVRVDDYHFEFVGARKESYRKHSRKPLVENGTLEDDQLRRDFTINALYLDLHPDRYGRLVDAFNGYDDLVDGIIRTPTDPDITFSDDPLRMLRAIRFGAVLQFFIEEGTFAGIHRNRERIKIVSMERISDELNKMLLAAKPSTGFLMMFKTEILPLIMPEVVALHGVDEVNGVRHKDNFYHTLKVLDNVARLDETNLWLRWAALLHDISKPETKRFSPEHGWTFHGHEDKGARRVPQIFARLRLPNNEKMRYVQTLVKLHLRPIALVDSEVSDSAIRRLIVDAGDDLPDLMKLCRADITTRDENRVQRYLANFDHVEERTREVEERDNLRNWQPPITGEIIMETFGLKPSQLVGAIKNEVRDAILDGVIPNEYDAAYTFMLAVGARLIHPAPESS